MKEELIIKTVTQTNKNTLHISKVFEYYNTEYGIL